MATLDGLRGAAAFLVVVYHAALVVPWLSAARGAAGADLPPLGSPGWWWTETPLQLLWAGPQAVLLFFVLSGLVLSVNGRPRSWQLYYRSRLVRLYVPVWGSLVLALGLVALVGRETSLGSSWVADHTDPTVSAVAHDTSLLLGTSNLNSPLWSLRWEVWFSLLLPAFVAMAAALQVKRWWTVVVLALAVLSGLGALPQVREYLPGAFLTAGLLQYMPVFGIGVTVAEALPHIREMVRRIGDGRRARAVSTGLLCAGLLAVCGVPRFWEGDASAVATVIDRAVQLIGVTTVVVVVAVFPDCFRWLVSRPLVWAGSRSFSIYLVHEPVMVAAAVAGGAGITARWGSLGPLVIIGALVTAEVFYRLVEGPTHRLAHRVGRAVPASRPS